MQDSDTNKPDLNELKEQSPAPSQRPELEPQGQPSGRPGATLREIQQTHEMLVGFRKGIKSGTFSGENIVFVAMGMQFLDNMVAQSQGQYEMAIRVEKEMKKQELARQKAEVPIIPEVVN